MSESTKRASISCKLTHEERAELVNKAEELGMTLSEYIHIRLFASSGSLDESLIDNLVMRMTDEFPILAHNPFKVNREENPINEEERENMTALREENTQLLEKVSALETKLGDLETKDIVSALELESDHETNLRAFIQKTQKSMPESTDREIILKMVAYAYGDLVPRNSAILSTGVGEINDVKILSKAKSV